MTPITSDLRKLVIDRADNCCEYCLISQEDHLLSFQADHIIAEKHHGLTEPSNLALSCPFCNRNKGSDIGSLDPDTGLLTPLFNPRTQVWDEHFRLNGAVIEPLTAEGRVTVDLLGINDAVRLERREALILLERYPCRPFSQG